MLANRRYPFDRNSAAVATVAAVALFALPSCASVMPSGLSTARPADAPLEMTTTARPADAKPVLSGATKGSVVEGLEMTTQSRAARSAQGDTVRAAAHNPVIPSGVGEDHVVEGAGPVKHIVLMIQENRSFDNFFATYPGADGTTTGQTHTGKTIPLKEQTLAALDIDHLRTDYVRDCDYNPSTGACKMDGFDGSKIGQQKAGRYPYQYVNPQQIAPYWTIASQYVLADHMFQTQGSGSFTAHQDLIAGATAIDAYDSLIDTPSSSAFWGCDAAPSTVTSLITTTGQYLQWGGPFPCITYPTGTLRDLLDNAGVSWRYYTPAHYHGTIGALWNAFDAIPAVRYGPEWTNNIVIPETTIYNDIKYGKLASLSWVVPSQQDSDHPHKLKGTYTGPQWIASVVNAVGQSPYWKNTTVIVVWDDWGGFYDHVTPPFFDDAGGLGFRVPMLVISPYVADGRVDHSQYEFGSILKYIEQTFSLGSLGTTDKRATSIGKMFDYLQPPRTFVPIPSSKSKAYFLHRAPDTEPVDSE